MNQYDNEKITKELIEFIDSSPSSYHAVGNISHMLEEAGFKRLTEGEKWCLEAGKGYFVVRNMSSVIAFKIPTEEMSGFSIAASHSDFPSFKIKSESELSSNDFVRLNTEKYGGMICASWLDRPLSVAGRIVTEEENGIAARLVNVDRDLLLIPNVAIHMNSSINDNFKFNPAVDTIPLYGGSTAKGSFRKTIAEAAGVSEDKIIGTDLFLYPRVKGTVWGVQNEFVSDRSLDNLQCAFSTLKGFLESETGSAVPVYASFDNEEVGSSTKQGAASTFLYDTLRRIASDADEEKFRRLLSSSFLLSCDNAHAIHPNHPEYADAENKVRINGGIVIKFNAAQKYTTDSVSEAVVKYICRRNGIPCQAYANRSDMGGGSTLGGIASTRVSINSADVGLPQLAMHSAYETAGVKDTSCMIELSRIFFSSAINAGADGIYNIKICSDN